MSSLFPIALFGLAGIIFIAASCLVIRPLRSASEKQGWILLILANLILAGWAGSRAYLLVISLNPSDVFELVVAIFACLAAILDCFGLAMLGNRFIKNVKSQKSALEDANRYLLSIDQAPQFIIIKDRQGIYQYANTAFSQLLGKKEKELIGESDFKYFPRAQANAFRLEEEKAIGSGIARTRDEEIRGVKGLHWLRTSRVPLLDEQHSFKGLLVSGYDITVQKQAEEVLRGLKSGLVTLGEAERMIGAPGDPSTAWARILEWAGKIAETEHVGVWQVLPERSTAVLKVGCGKLSGFVNMQLRAGEDIVWKVWQSGNAEWVTDYAGWPGRSQRMRDMGFSEVIGLPIQKKEQNTFVITLFSDKVGIHFRDEQLQLLKVLGLNAADRLAQIERVAGLQTEIEEWKRKQDHLNYRMRLDHILAVIAAHFINLDPEKIDEGITRSLQTITKFAGIERSYLVLFPKNGVSESMNPNWYGSGVTAEIKEDVFREDFQWILSKINQLEIIHVPRLPDLQGDQEEAVAYIQAKGIKSFTAIPLIANRLAIGYLGFESYRTELEWSQEILGLLKISSEMFASLLERKWTARGYKETLEKSNRQIRLLEMRHLESGLMSEMGDLLQACRTSDEAYPIIVRFLQRLIPLASGALYIIHDPKDPAEKVAGWGDIQPGQAEHELGLNECWSLRRGRLYSVQDPTTEPICTHIKEPLQAGYMCVPMIAQGVAIGVLHLRLPASPLNDQKFTTEQQRLAAKIGEYIAAPLTNLKLRDDLRSQAIRDPLTKLFNRRYMEETLDREIRRAIRHSTSVGIIMFDIDRMKPINDRFGHDAGDLVLKILGRELEGLFRGEDVACRYGGDEFTIVLPEASLADVWRRAEQMRDAVKRLDLKYDGKQLGTLTLSIGVAAYPDHGQTAERILLACDAASYASKSEGGDRIMMGHKSDS